MDMKLPVSEKPNGSSSAKYAIANLILVFAPIDGDVFFDSMMRNRRAQRTSFGRV
jgi:hypothetical protein